MGFHFQISKKTHHTITKNVQFIVPGANKNEHINKKRGLYFLKLALFRIIPNNTCILIIPAVEGSAKK